MPDDGKDDAAFLSDIAIGLASVRAANSTDAVPTLSVQNLDHVVRAVGRRTWPLDVARAFPLPASLRLLRPISCSRIRAAARAARHPEGWQDNDVDIPLRWTSALCLAEFGAALNADGYAQLRAAIVDRRTTKKRLRRILSAATVWWDCRGNLIVNDLHLVTKLLIWTGMLGCAIFLLAIVQQFCVTVQSRGWELPQVLALLLGVGSATMVLSGLWFLGPFSTRAARSLLELLRDAEKRPRTR